MYEELSDKLADLVNQTDVDGLRLLAWQELKRDGLITGGLCDVELMMDQMKEIMALRFEEAVAKRAGEIVMRQVRKLIGTDLKAWVAQKNAMEYVNSQVGEDFDLGCGG